VPPLPVPPGTVPPAPPAAVAGQETLAPPPVDSSTPDTVELAARPAATLRGQSTWEEGYDRLTQSFQQLQSEMDKAGVRVTGKPLATFLETDDMGFRFQALLPVATPPATRPPGLPADIAFGSTPAGKAIRFVHKAPYDDIDSTYEAVSAYLDTKGIEVKDNFTEEYVAIGSGAGDTGLELYIYVQPK
jgi:effector-binding domain-containing protein